MLHLMKGSVDYDIKFCGVGNCIVENCKYLNGKIQINKNQWFEDVPNNVWEMLVGGYQPLQKWMKDRKGIQLSEEDILHYQKMISILKQTIEIMKDIDDIIII